MTSGTMLYYLVALILSAANMFLATFLVKRYRLGFLVPFRTFQFAFSIHCFLYFGGQIFIQETVTISSVDRYAAQQVIGTLSSPAFLIYSFATVLWCADLLGRSLSRGLIIVFWTTQLLLEGACIASMFALVPENIELDHRLVGIVVYGFHLPLFLSTGALVWGARSQSDPLRRRLSAGLGGTYLVGFLLIQVCTGPVNILPAGAVAGFVAVGISLYAINAAGLAVLTFTLRGAPVRQDDPAERRSDRCSSRPDPRLTRREQEIVPLVAVGLTNDEIADELFISPKTVRNTLSSIFRKVDVRNRVELTVYYNELDRD